MSSPMSDYSYSQDSQDFLGTYKRKIVQNDPRLEFHQDIVKDYGESYERAYQLLNTFYATAYKATSFMLGNQWSLEELAYLNNQRRSSYTYNNVRRVVNAIDGYQRKNRCASVVSPVEDASEDTAELLSDAMQHVMAHANGYEAISDAFKSSLVTGISFLSPYLDYRDDPVSGDIKFHRDDWNGIIYDPFVTKRDLSDCSFLTRRKFLSRTEVISLLPDKQDVIESLPWGSRDDKFTYLPYARQWGMQKLLNYNEYWRRRWTTKNVLVDMETGETKPWNGDKKRLQLFREVHPNIEVMRKPVQSVELGIIVEGELLYYGEDPFGLQEYPFVPLFCVFDSSYDLWEWKLQGVVKIIQDPQVELNKRRSKMVDLIDNQLNSGWIAKTNSVSNPTSLFKSGQGQVIFMKPEAQMTDIQRIPSASIDPSQFQLNKEFEDDMVKLVGMNAEMFGMPENENLETAGILSKMRQGAGLINLQGIFDGLRESQQILGKKVMKLMQINYTPEKIKLITGKEPTAEFYSKSFAKYNVVVDEGVLTDTQQQHQFIQLTALKSMGVNITDEELIDASNLHNKKKIKERIAGERKSASEQQQQQVKMAMENQAVLTHAANSKAESDLSLAHEREAKIGLDKALNAERMTRAEEERTAGVLNLVKAVKELEGMDTDNLIKKLEFLRNLEMDEHTKQMEIKSAANATPDESAA